LVLVRKRSFGETILKYAYNMDSKVENDYLDGKLLKKYVVSKI
jgi:hypothetical protein